MTQSPMETYLGQLFDEMGGRGAEGWRMLVETEDHLRCAVAELEAAGHERFDAEETAVARFGRPTRLARDLDAANGLSWATALARVVGGAWLLGVVALLSIGATSAFAVGAGHLWGKTTIAGDAPTQHYSASRCAYLLEYFPQSDGSCRNASVTHHYEEEVRDRIAAGILGAAALGVLVLARRNRGPFRRLRQLATAPPSPIVHAVGATSFGIAGLFTIGLGIDAFATNQPWGAWANLLTGVAFVPAFLWFALHALLDVRRVEPPARVELATN